MGVLSAQVFDQAAKCLSKVRISSNNRVQTQPVAFSIWDHSNQELLPSQDRAAALWA